uniref:Rhodanese domain-containing protein n=1 Tax=Arundo donax TaxID=35708 RepID=A0A0A9HKY5_ARUDO
MFRVFGHSRVWVLDGGLPQWRASGFNLDSNSSDDAVLKSKAANNAVEEVYNGELTNTITFQTEFQPQLFWTL